MSDVTIYHNPKCSKSREVLSLLKERGIDPHIIHYLETPPDAKSLDVILKMLDMEPKDLMRKKEDVYRKLKIDDRDLSRQESIQIIVDNPILIERPIVVKGNRAAIGRPAEKVLAIL